MAAVEIIFTADGLSDFRGLDGSVKAKLIKVLDKKLAADPQGYGTPLRGALAGYHKHEFATHRVIYRIYPERNLVLICAVGSRKGGDAQDIYNQLSKVVQSGRLAAQVRGVLQGFLGVPKPPKKS